MLSPLPPPLLPLPRCAPLVLASAASSLSVFASPTLSLSTEPPAAASEAVAAPEVDCPSSELLALSCGRSGVGFSLPWLLLLLRSGVGVGRGDVEKSLEELNKASKVAGSLSPNPISVIKGGRATAAASTAAESNNAVKAVPRPFSDLEPLLDPPECGLPT